jgi:ribosomal protein S18 acetylase RimI-like enzyme
MRIGPLTRDLLVPLHPLLNVSSGRPVSLDDERARFDRVEPEHWRVAWDDDDRLVGFVRESGESTLATGEAHAVHGPGRLDVLRALLTAYLGQRPPGPLRFVVAADDPFGDLLGELEFVGERHLACQLRLGDIPGSVGVRLAGAADAEAVQRAFGPELWASDAGTVLVTVGGVRGALRLELAEDEDDPDEVGAVVAIAVEEASRRQGIAQRLLRAACEEAARRGFTRLVARIPEQNAAARALFDGFGFVRRPAADQRWWVRT